MTAHEIRDLRARIVEIARCEIGVREIGENNRGPRVEEYLRAAGVQPPGAWCAAFVRWVYAQAGAPCAPFVRAGVARAWRGWPARWRLLPEHAASVRPGDVVILARSTAPFPARSADAIRAGRITQGHCGIVVACDDDGFDAVEGNVWHGHDTWPRGGVATCLHGWADEDIVGWLRADTPGGEP